MRYFGFDKNIGTGKVLAFGFNESSAGINFYSLNLDMVQPLVVKTSPVDINLASDLVKLKGYSDEE